MIKKKHVVSFILVLFLCLSLASWMWLLQKSRHENKEYHQNQYNLRLLNEQFLHIQKLNEKTIVAQKKCDELEVRGFFKQPSSKLFLNAVHSSAQECHVTITHQMRQPSLKFKNCLWKQSMDLSIQADLDQDIFEFVDKLMMSSEGIVLITQLNLFQKFMKGAPWPRIQGEMKLDIYQFYKAL